MDKPLIQIPEACKPSSEILYGYSGGMALYVAHWESVMLLFEYTNIAYLAYVTVTTNKILS
jgi:hypothetical protein